nr:ATP-binding protein [Asticcacaulis solisilvae]
MNGIQAQVASLPFAYSENEIENYGVKAMSMSGDERLYALWRVLFAYKTFQNEAKMQAWHNRLLGLAQKERDSRLDLLARFMYQAYQNEIGGYTLLKDADWRDYQSASSVALQNIVMLERQRTLQYQGNWAEAIDVGDALVLRLPSEGSKAQGLMMAAQQAMAYNMLRVGDNTAYASHMLAAARLAQHNAFYQQQIDLVYDLAYFAAQDNNITLASSLQKLYADEVAKHDISELKPWSQQLCAIVEDKAEHYRAVIDCLSGTSVARGLIATGYDAFQLRLLTKAYAREGRVLQARQSLDRLNALPATMISPDPLFTRYIEAYLKSAEGHSDAAFQALGDLTLPMQRQADQRRIAAIQDMYRTLRKQLDSKTAESRLLNKQVEMQRIMLVLAVAIGLLLTALAAVSIVWVMRMRRMQWQLRDAHEHAQAANAAKSRFLAVMSHELRTPLNGVLGMAQALRKGKLNDEQHGQVDILIESGETLMVLLNDVLDMSRIEAGKVELAPTAASMKDMIERVINTYIPTVEDKPVALRYDIDDSAQAPMMFDVLRVYQCLSNLVSNATKFTERGTIRVVASATPYEDRPGYLVRVEVRDTGIGMSRATVDKLFEAYAQADAGTARKYGGSGLGLSISRRLTELMQGTLSVTSEEGVGSIFVMTFHAGEVVNTPARAPEPEPEAQSDHTRGYRILLVDDHPVNRKVARLFLEPFGFEITEAVDGQEALDAHMENFDLVLMDINMPRLGGIDATRLFRETEAAGHHVPIVALTADAMPEQIDACLAAGMDAHISKPIIMDKLIDTVTSLLHIDTEQGAAPAPMAKTA